jgi:hypothetical protein
MLWAYATMGREPGAGVMRELEGRAEMLAGSFNAQEVANTLWAACVFSILRAPGEGRRWINAIAHRLVSLGKDVCLNAADRCQVHQFFVCCTWEPRLRVEEISDMRALKETCREAFECTQTAPSATQMQVSETLRHMGLSVEDEVRCPKSGYSIDILVVGHLGMGGESSDSHLGMVDIHDSHQGMGGESSSSVRTWAVEFDGPQHFLASRAPTGATLLKRRHLELLGHALVIVPYWEWDGCKGIGERVQYLRGKLAH